MLLETVRVTELYAYPVKSCAAVALEEATLDGLGLVQDRRFAFVGKDGRALTQRDQPLLALIKPRLEAGELRLDCGGILDLSVPLEAFGGNAIGVQVWRKQLAGKAVAASLIEQACDFLGREVSLVALERGSACAFADSEPVLVTAQETLSLLNRQIAAPVGMERFRPNVVLEGAQAEDELRWLALRGNEVELDCARACARCEVTTIDQKSGVRRGDEPLRTLNERFEGDFGVYCRVVRAGRLRRGEALQAV